MSKRRRKGQTSRSPSKLRRQARRAERRARDSAARRRLYEAAWEYGKTLRYALFRSTSEDSVVCERCYLEQPRGNGAIEADGSVSASPCVECGHEYACTAAAAFAAAT